MKHLLGVLVLVYAVTSVIAPIALRAQKKMKPQAASVADTVTFKIDMRKPIAAKWFDPKTEIVGVRGGIPPLDWASTLQATDTEGKGIYSVTTIFRKRTLTGKPVIYSDRRIPYKFKVDGPGSNPNDGWESGDNSSLVCSTPSLTIERAFNNVQKAPLQHTLTGNIKLHEAFRSQYLPARNLAVYLPPNYVKDSSHRYPVLYMHDGQNIFDDSTANGSEWHVDEIAEYLINNGQIQPVIIVGVYTIPQERIDEYTPTSRLTAVGVGRTRNQGGKGNLYGQMLMEEVKPFIDRTYRVLPDAANTAIGGSSLGGLISLYLGMKNPAVFGKLLVVSPSVWWDNNYILNEMMARTTKFPAKVWLDMGTNEGGEALEGARNLRQTFTTLGWKLGDDFQYMEAFDGRHDEASWAARVEPMLRFLFPAAKK